MVVALALLGQRLARPDDPANPSVSFPFSVLLGCSILSSVAVTLNPLLFADAFGWT